jgi:hypothetical protein
MDSGASSATDLSGEAYNRNSDVRYGAHCPGIIELIFKDGKHFMALTGVIVNLSVTGCLFSNDKMPWSNLEGRKPGDSLFDIINERCHIYIPWTGTPLHSPDQACRLLHHRRAVRSGTQGKPGPDDREP